MRVSFAYCHTGTMTPSYITPTEHERSEWARMAECCAKSDHPGLACLYKAASILTTPLAPWTYDALQKSYRRWLVSGFDQFSEDALRD